MVQETQRTDPKAYPAELVEDEELLDLGSEGTVCLLARLSPREQLVREVLDEGGGRGVAVDEDGAQDSVRVLDRVPGHDVGSRSLSHHDAVADAVSIIM